MLLLRHLVEAIDKSALSIVGIKTEFEKITALQRRAQRLQAIEPAA